MRIIENRVLIKFITIMLIIMGSVYAVDNPCELPNNKIYLNGGEVWYNVSTDIGGFQFSVDGSTVSGASGGDAASAGFVVQASNTTVLGFSFSGASVPLGCGILTNLNFSEVPTGLSSIVMSDPFGSAFIVEYYIVEDSCDDIDADDICDDVDDCIGEYDNCGECNGDDSTCTGCADSDACNYDSNATLDSECSYPEVGYDCFGDCVADIDCLDECGGIAELDECGVCNGDNDCLNENHYNISISSTGISQLLIFQESISDLQLGDEVGVFDLNGVLNDGDCELVQGALLVGSGIWTGEQLEITAIGSINVCDFGGVMRPGFDSGNTIEIRIWRDGQEIIPDVEYSFGDGEFGELLPDVISSITTCNGTVDDCGLCNGDNSSCSDCAGVPNGNAELDCLGDCNGNAELDECGICDGDNSTCSGCTDELALNYDSEAIVDNASCEFPLIEIDEPEELESYDSSVDIDIPEVIFEDVEVDIDIPAGALDIPEGTEVTLEASEVSENEIQDLIDNSSSGDADLEVFEGISFEATDENGNPIELTEGATLDIELTFEPNRDEYDLGYITEDGEIVALGANCIDNGDGSWTCAGDGPGFGSYIVYSFDESAIVDGCTLLSACNYNESATLNDGSCAYLDLCGECGGDDSTCAGCDGEANSGLEFDECGICDGIGASFECSDGSIGCDLSDCCGDVLGVYPGYGPSCLWNPIGSTVQSFIIFDEITFNGESISHGQEGGPNGQCLDGNCDILSAMYNGNSVGWTYAPIINGGITVAIETTDGTTAGTESYPAINGAFAPEITFNFYDVSEDRVYYSVASSSLQLGIALLYGSLNIEGDDLYQSCDGFLFGENTCYDLEPSCPLSYDSSFNPNGGAVDCSYCSIDYDFCGCTDSETPTYDSSAILNDGSCEYGFSFTHDLGSGNNLLSFPGYLENNSSQELLEGLIGEGTDVAFLLGQGVGLFNTSNGWSGNLNSIAPTSGYWLNVIGEHQWDIEFASALEPCTSYDISFGNNLLSFKWGAGNSSTMEALGGEEFASENFNFILGQGVGLFNTANGWSGNLNTLIEGKGYWVNISNSDMDFKWGFENCSNANLTSQSNVESQKEMVSDFKFIQSTEQAFYLINDLKVDANQPNEGDIVLAYSGDMLVGSAYWIGRNTVLPVMGKDNSIETFGFSEPGDRISLKLYRHNNGEVIDLIGNVALWDNLLVTEIELLKGVDSIELPNQFYMEKAYPNPFNPVTNFKITIPEDGFTHLGIYDINGKLIETIVDERIESGIYKFQWAAKENPSGLYFIKGQFGQSILSEKIILVK